MATEGAPAERTDTVWFAHWIRAISMMVVVWVHLFVAYWSENETHAPIAHVRPVTDAATRPVWNFLFGDFDVHLGYGTAAVGTFFLISGFVIPMTLENRSVGRFVFARVCRVWPTWLAGLALIALTFWIHATVTDVPVGISSRTWLLNASLVPDLGQVPFINPVCWTLLIEVKFYALCALLAATVGLHRALPIACIAAGSGLFGVLVYGKQPDVAADHPWLWNAAQFLAWDSVYLCCILIGVCFYNHFRRVWSTARAVGTAAVCLASMAFGLVVVNAHHEYRVALTVGLLASVPIFLLAYVLRHRIPSNRTINTLANLSYPLYVLHYIVGIQLIAMITAVGGSPLVATMGAFLIVLMAAQLIHRWVEAPTTSFGKTFSSSG